MWPDYATIQFRGYRISYATTAARSGDGTGKEVVDAPQDLAFTVKRRDFAFELVNNRLADFLAWIAGQGVETFEFHDPDTDEDVDVRLPGGRTAVSLSGSDIRAGERYVLTGRGALESNINIQRMSGALAWPYAYAVPRFAGFQWALPRDTTTRTRMADGAMRQARAAQPGIDFSADFECDILNGEGIATMVEWVETTDDRPFTLAFPDGIERAVKLVGGAGGAEFRGVGRTPHVENPQDDVPIPSYSFLWRGSFSVVAV